MRAGIRQRGLMVALILAMTAMLDACSPRRALEAVGVLQDIQAGNGPSLLKQVTPEPTRTAIVFTVDGRQRQADLYSPGERRARRHGSGAGANARRPQRQAAHRLRQYAWRALVSRSSFPTCRECDRLR